MKTVFLLLMVLLLVSCKSSEKNNDSASNFLIDRMTLYGIQKNVTQSISEAWTIQVLDHNRIKLVCSGRYSTDMSDSDVYTNYYFGEITSSKTNGYDFEIMLNKNLSVTDRIKPYGGYWDTDTIPVYIDSIAFSEVKNWTILVRQKNKQDSVVKIKDRKHLFLMDKDSSLNLLLQPDSFSNYQPISIETSFQCGVSINSYLPDYKYYLNKENDGYYLMIEKLSTGKNQEIEKVKLSVK